METIQDFVLNVIGLEPSTSRKIDEIDENFKFPFTKYELSESDVYDALQLNPKRVGNYLIRLYYEREIEYMVSRFKDDGIDESMFDYEVNGSASLFIFNGDVYNDEDSLEEAIEKYIEQNSEEQYEQLKNKQQ